MPYVELTPENRVQSVFEYPKLMLEKNERARILVIEKAPLMEYVHTLRTPKVINGQVQMETVDNFGRTVEQPVMDFMSRPICLGDLSVLADKNIDPEDCPACEVAAESDVIEAPKRRYAMHVVWYSTKPGTFEVADPFGAKLVAWAFTDKVFNQLIAFHTEWGDLQQHDLLLGPCEVKQFQKFEISIAAQAEWKKSEERANFIKSLYEENKAKDLQALIGRKLPRETLAQDVKEVERKHHLAFGRTGGETVVEEGGGLIGSTANLDDILSGATTQTLTEDAEPLAEGEAVNIEVEEISEPKPKRTRAKKPVEEPEADAEEAEEGEKKPLDLEKILGDLA